MKQSTWLRNSERFSVAVQTPIFLHSFSQSGQTDVSRKMRKNSQTLLQALFLGEGATAQLMQEKGLTLGFKYF